MRRARFALTLAILGLCWATPAGTQEGPLLALDRLERVWAAKDVAGYLALWELPSEEARNQERAFAESAFGWGTSRLVMERPTSVPKAVTRLRISAQLVAIQEPRGRVDQCVFVFEQRGASWVLVERQPAGRIDGLVHLSLDAQGYRADGLKIQLEDFELAMTRGTLYTSPAGLGPTVAVFVGEGTVHVRPTPQTEREQLRQYTGHPELSQKIGAAFVRIHPSDLPRVLTPYRLELDPGSPSRVAEAQRFFDANASGSFVLDGSLPGSPWWVFPAIGDALVAFDAGARGILSFAVTHAQPESISLFNRTKRIQICLYPAAGRTTRYSDDEGRELDVVSHELRVRFEPREARLLAEDTLRFRLLGPANTIRLKLDDALKVESITSAEGRHLFFRVRHQDTLMVSLGALAVGEGTLALKVKYSGVLLPAPVESELQLGGPERSSALENDIQIDKSWVYANREAWYPQPPGEDYATAHLRFDVPSGFTAVTGGERVSARVEGERNLTEYRLTRPGKYFTVVFARLSLVGSKVTDGVTLQAFGGLHTKPDAQKALEQAGLMLRFFTEQFGICPYPEINIVMIEGEVPGGHSPPGMLVVARRPFLMKRPLADDPANFSDVSGFFLAHELAHQWWGQGVAGQNYRERWLSEGFAQYAAALWARHAYGEGVFLSVLKRMGRWAMQESHKGPIHLGYRLGHVKGDPQVFRALVYDKGAYVLHMLRGVVGDAAFREALLGFQGRFRFAKAGTEDLREAFERASGKNLVPYFDQWVYATQIPALNFAHRQQQAGRGYRTAVEVKARDLPGPLPLEVAVVHDRGRERQRFVLGPEGGTVSIESSLRPRRIEVNSDRGLLAEVDGS